MAQLQPKPVRPEPLHLRVEPRLGALRDAVDQIGAFLSAAGCPAPEIADLRLALVEAGNNLILHSGSNEAASPFELSAACAPDEIRIELADQTPGFAWPAEVRLPDDSSEAGRGLYLIHAVMDRVDYERNGAGNRLRLVKKRG